jgi:hypothetical protein
MGARAAVSKGFARVCESLFPMPHRLFIQTRSDAPKAPPMSRTSGGVLEEGACPLLPFAHRPSTTVAADESTPPVPLATATRASSTWRGPLSPRSWRVASISVKMPYMPGWQ